MKEQMQKEIAKVQDADQRAFLEKILDYETTNNVDIEKSPVLEGMLPIMLGRQMAEETGKEVDAEVWYQQYRTMKALLKKKDDIPAHNRQRIEEGIQALIQIEKDLHPEKSILEIEAEVRTMISSTNIEDICNRIGYDLTRKREVVYDEDGEPVEIIENEDEGPTDLDLIEEICKEAGAFQDLNKKAC